ncbi:MAG: hypothetical protein EBZ74_05545, partial [Planctomycetia bacterium]|nr:hypothetical protein [Planctomycetia bacterium]
MSGPASWSWRRRGGAAAAAAVLLAVALPAAGEPPRANPRGGFLPAREQPSISGGETRDEIVRRHDLNSDGRIDEGEAEVA